MYSTLIAGQTYLVVGLEDTLGLLELTRVGIDEDVREGADDSFTLGDTEGNKLGSSDLIFVGRLVGSIEVGVEEGLELGPSDLTIEGVIEASTLGRYVGSELGSSVFNIEGEEEEEV